MNRKMFLVGLLVLGFGSISTLRSQSLVLENQYYRVTVDRENGSVTSLLVKSNNSDLIDEKKLAANFRICLQTEDNLSNYIDGMEQKPSSVTKEGNTISVSFSGMKSPVGSYPIDLSYTVSLKDDYVSFQSKLTNNAKFQLSEFWFPRLGGWTDFGNHRDAKIAVPGYSKDSRHSIPLFKEFPGTRWLGAEAAEWSTDYPGMVMPWYNIYDEKNNTGLYMGYHDTICRYSTWHMYLAPNITGRKENWLSQEEAGDRPVGIVFSHVRYPFVHSGETYNSGEFIVRAHKGDWHSGSELYGKWFREKFPFDKSDSWLRKKSAWFSSILYQPEDRVVADYKTFGQWTKDANKYGITTHELIGWDSGGLERNYPFYTPAEILGGKEGFKSLLKSIKDRGEHCLVFCNYNVLDQNTDWYKQDLFKYQAQDQFGTQHIWMGWGESTLMARKNLSVRYHVRSSAVPGINRILDNHLVQLVKDGAQALQIDKLVVGHSLDFNPLNTLKPDEALCEGLVNAIGDLYAKCRKIDPRFRMASEMLVDRLIPYIDIGYRNSMGYEISPLHYVFPEWTGCQHIDFPREFRGINGAVLTGSVIVVEPDTYQGTLEQPIYQDLAKYIQEVERIRNELTDYIFMGKYLDNQHGSISEAGKPSGSLHYKVWLNEKTGKYALIVANDSRESVNFKWSLSKAGSNQAVLHQPFQKATEVRAGQNVAIKGEGLMIFVEK